MLKKSCLKIEEDVSVKSRVVRKLGMWGGALEDGGGGVGLVFLCLYMTKAFCLTDIYWDIDSGNPESMTCTELL